MPQIGNEPNQGNPENSNYQNIPDAPENVPLVERLVEQNQETTTCISISFVFLKVDFHFFQLLNFYFSYAGKHCELG